MPVLEYEIVQHVKQLEGRSSMIHVTVPEAQQRLPELLAAAANGLAVEIEGINGRRFFLTAQRPRPPITGVPRAGSCQGLIEMADDFGAPLDELKEYME